MELTRAQLEALLGQRERAVALLRDAFARGLSMSTHFIDKWISNRFAGSRRSMS